MEVPKKKLYFSGYTPYTPSVKYKNEIIEVSRQSEKVNPCHKKPKIIYF